MNGPAQVQEPPLRVRDLTQAFVEPLMADPFWLTVGQIERLRWFFQIFTGSRGYEPRVVA